MFGALVPTLWAIYRVFTVAVGNSALGGQAPERTHFREVPELWTTAAVLTLTAVALTWMIVRYSTARRTSIVVLTALTFVAATLNWTVLLLAP